MRSRSESGFTLIEVVLAMGLFLLGAVAILGFLTYGAALSRTAGLRTLSAEAVEAITAELEEGLFPLEADGTVGPAEPVVDRPVPGYPELVYSATPVEEPDDSPGATRVRVDVEVRWKGGTSRRGRRFSVLLLREVPFGERLRRTFRERQRDRSESEAPPGPENTP